MERPTTAAAIMSFAERLEDDSSRLYEKLANKFPAGKETLCLFAAEGRKNKVFLVRTYQETITDAIEACFSFGRLNLNSYKIDAVVPDTADYSEALKTAIRLEEEACRFYKDTYELSKSLLATIPMAFKRTAEKRNIRLQILKSLLDNLKSSKER